MYDWRGGAVCPNFDSRSRRRCGNVETRVLCGFQAPRAGRTVVAECCIIPPPERHFHSEARFIGHSVENVLFGRPTERKYVPFRKPRRTHDSTDSRSEPKKLDAQQSHREIL